MVPRQITGSGPGDDVDGAVSLVPFDTVEPAIAVATHILVTIPPDAGGDPVLNRYADVITASHALRWIGYL